MGRSVQINMPACDWVLKLGNPDTVRVLYELFYLAAEDGCVRLTPVEKKLLRRALGIMRPTLRTALKELVDNGVLLRVSTSRLPGWDYAFQFEFQINPEMIRIFEDKDTSVIGSISHKTAP